MYTSPQQPMEVSITANEHETATFLLDAVRKSDLPIQVEKESQRIADLFNFSRNKNLTQNLENGSKALADDLQKLAGNMQLYNQLLQGVHDKMHGEPAFNPFLELKDWNENTGTWGKVTVVTAALENVGGGYCRIVQPGNTLSQIAFDSIAESGSHQDYKDYVNMLVVLNAITNQDTLRVGQAILLPV